MIDDDESIRRLLDHRLNAAGYTVQVCSDGQEAAELLEGEFEPTLLVLDVMMPRLDGTRLLRMIRNGELPIDSDTPIIMLTSRGQEKDVIEGFESGADSYVTKPFRADELLAQVRQYTER